MTKSIQAHLQSITVENLMIFKAGAFLEMASSHGRHGSVRLGVNTVGKFVVKTKTETFTFSKPETAIEKYTELVSD